MDFRLEGDLKKNIPLDQDPNAPQINRGFYVVNICMACQNRSLTLVSLGLLKKYSVFPHKQVHKRRATCIQKKTKAIFPYLVFK